jgi:hypothetical protein
MVLSMILYKLIDQNCETSPWTCNISCCCGVHTEVHTIHVRMSWKVSLDLIRLQIPYLPAPKSIKSIPRKHQRGAPNLERTILTISTPSKPAHSAYMASKGSDELARPALRYVYSASIYSSSDFKSCFTPSRVDVIIHRLS